MPLFKFNFSDKTNEYCTLYSLIPSPLFEFEVVHVVDICDLDFLIPTTTIEFIGSDVPNISFPIPTILIEANTFGIEEAALDITLPSVSLFSVLSGLEDMQAEFDLVIAPVLDFEVYSDGAIDAELSIKIKPPRFVFDMEKTVYAEFLISKTMFGALFFLEKAIEFDIHIIKTKPRLRFEATVGS